MGAVPIDSDFRCEAVALFRIRRPALPRARARRHDRRPDGAAFVAQQSLGGAGGRELKLVTTASGRYLVRVCFIQGTPHDPRPELQSQLYRWNAGRFEVIAEFPTSGGTDAAFFRADGTLYLAVSNSLSPEVRYRADTVVYRCAL